MMQQGGGEREGEGERDSMDYEAFYAERVKSFSEERRLFAHYLSMVKLDKTEGHNLEWQNKKLESEIDKGKSLANAHEVELKRLSGLITVAKKDLNCMYDEKAKRLEQIQALSELQQPVQRDTTYFINERFLRFDSNKENNASDRALNKKSGLVGAKQRIVENVMRLMPKTGEMTSMEKIIETSKIKCSNYLREISALINDTEDERLVYKANKFNNLDGHVKETHKLLDEAHNFEMQCFMAVAEMLRLRHGILVAQRQEVEELERLDNDRHFFALKEQKTKRELQSDMVLMKKRLQDELAETTKDFRRQARELDRQLTKRRDMESAAMKFTAQESSSNSEAVLSEIKLRARLSMCKGRYERLRRRAALEKEGFARELGALEKKLLQLSQAPRHRHQAGPGVASRVGLSSAGAGAGAARGAYSSRRPADEGAHVAARQYMPKMKEAWM